MSPRPRSRTLGRAPTTRKALVGLGVAATALLAFPAVAGAQDADPKRSPSLGQQINLLWIVIGAVLVIFMQAGFALVETGFCRAKHAAHVVSTNFAIFGLGLRRLLPRRLRPHVRRLSYALPGFDFGFDHAPRLRPSSAAATGSSCGRAASPSPTVGPGGAGAAALGFFLYMVAFMDTVATIPTGAMAERWKWKSFVGWGLFCGAIYYPLFGAWTWGGGWLSSSATSMDLGYGYVDFAGSGVVHAMGGVAALAGAIVLGPRIGKFNKDGSANTHPRPPHPDGHARLLHPAVRLVRLQRRLHLRGDRRAVRRRGDQHRASRLPSVRWRRCSIMHVRPASPTPG